jgi:hypothetical protein
VNERTLSRRLATGVVEALKSHGHILVVKGGTAALARELDELMTPSLTIIEPRLGPRSPIAGEPTSTFGDEAIDSAVEEMVAKLTRALMSSDHVEDVFAEDLVIRRDIFRAVRDGLLSPRLLDQDGHDQGLDHPSVQVKLDTLGYVAATVSRRVDPTELRRALDRAASVAHARFSAWSPELREATFRVEGGGSDERLDLEEAVADELADLVEQGVVDLPTIERRLDLGRAVPSGEQRAVGPRIDALAEATLLRSGCAAVWDFADPRTLRITFTPLSDQDARGVDVPMGVFTRELAALLSPGEAGRRGVAPEAPKVRAPAEAAPRPAESKPARARAEPQVVEETRAAAPAAAKSAPKRTAKRASVPKRADTAAAEPAEPAVKPRASKAKADAAARPSSKGTTKAAAKAPAKKR